MSKKWKISLFSFLFILLIFVVTACDNKKTGDNNTGDNSGKTTETTEWGEWKVTKAATCTEEGVETRTAKNDSSKTETRPIQKTAHTPTTAVIENGKEATCTEDGSYDEVIYCKDCHTVMSTEHHTETAHGHDYHSDSTPATCEHAETITYTCENCHNEYTVTGNPKLQHDLKGDVKTRESLVNGETCKYKIETYDECDECGKEIVLTTNYVTRHDYTAKVTKEATCSEKGVLTYTCSHGDHTYTVDIAVNTDAHAWGTGVVDSSTGFTTYKCSHCETTKSTFNAADLVVAEVPAKAIQEAEEIELKNATIVLDDSVKEQFADATSVKLSAEEVDANSLEDLDQATKEKIGDNKVFDFSCEVAGNAVSQFEGSMKVTIPYTLKDGEDPNHIMVWYLDGEEVESIEAVYSNGTVTFETTHFSRYVVVKMTPQELCELYDHIWVLTEQKDSTCVEYGQLMYVCSRCGEVKNELMPLVEHDFDIDHEHSVAATYDAEGYTEYACRICDATKRVVIPKKPKPADNIIQNLINSLLEEDYYTEVTGMETFRNTKLAKSQIKITEDGNVYLISQASNEDGEEYIAIIDLGNGYVYSVSDNEYSVSTTSVNFDLNLVKKYVYLATSYIPTELGNEVFNKLSSILFTVEKTDDAVTLTFDMEKLLALYDNLLNKTIAENIDIYVNKGVSDLIPVVVNIVLEMTVEDIMKMLESAGITLDKVAEMTKEFNNGKPLFTAEMIAPYIEECKDMKVIDLINMIIPMVEKMMKQGGGSSVGPKQPDVISESGTVTLTGNDGQTTTDTTADDQEAQGFTTAEIVALVQKYLNKKIIDIVAEAMHAPSVDDVAQMLPSKEQITQMLDKVLELKVTLSPSYQFKKIEAKVELNATIKQMAKLDADKEYKINITLEHGTKEDVLNVDETILTVKNSVQIFDVSLNSHDWLTKALDEYLDIKGDNELTYEFTKTQDGYLVTSSEFEVEYIKEWNSKEEPVLGTMKAYYVFSISNSESSYRYVYRTDTGFRKYFDIRGYVIYKLPDGQLEHEELNIYGNMTYNSTTKKYTLVNENNSKVDYNDYEIITYDAFKEQHPNYNISNPDNYLFYKSTNKVTQKVDYSYTWIGSYKTDIIYLLTEAESKATLVQKTNYSYAVSYTDEALIGYQICYKVTKTGLVYDEIDAIYASPYSYYKNGLRAPRYNYYTREVTEPVDKATFKIVFEQPTAVNACTNKCVVKVSIDGGKTYASYEYFVSEHKGERTETEQKDGCMVHVTVTCSACNEVVYEYDADRHEWEETIVERAVGTNSGIKVRACKNCHEEEYIYEYWCAHYNHKYDEAKEEWVCNDCGFTWSGVEYPVIFLQQVQDENYKISYQLGEKFKFSDFDSFEDFYSVGLFVYYTYTNENETVEGYDGLDCDYEVVSVAYKTIEKREFCHNYLVFDRAEVRELLAAWAQENNQSGIQYHICIGITDNMGGEYSYFLFLE